MSHEIDDNTTERNTRRGKTAEHDLPVPSLREIVTILFRRKWTIVSIALLVSAGVVGYAAMLPNVYSSEALLLIRDQRGGLAFNPASQSLITAQPGSASRSVTTEISILKSVDLARKVVSKLDPETVREMLLTPEQLAAANADGVDGEIIENTEALNRYATQLIQSSIEARGAGSTISVAFMDASPVRAQAVLSTIVDTYLDIHLQVHGSSTSPKFFEGKVEETRREIAEKETELEELKQQYGIRAISDERVMALQRLAEIDTQHSELKAKIEGARATIKSQEELAEALEDIPGMDGLGTNSPSNSPLARLEARKFELELQEIDLSAKYVDSKELRSVRQQLAAVQEKIDAFKLESEEAAEALPGGGGPGSGLLHQQRIALLGLEAQEASLLESRAKIEARLDKLEEHEAEIVARQQEIADLRSSLAGLQRGLEQARIDAELDRDKVSNVSLLQEPTFSPRPIAPRRKRIVLFGVFVAFVAALGAAFVREYLDDSVKTGDDLTRKLGMDLLVSVPESEFRQCT